MKSWRLNRRRRGFSCTTCCAQAAPRGGEPCPPWAPPWTRGLRRCRRCRQKARQVLPSIAPDLLSLSDSVSGGVGFQPDCGVILSVPASWSGRHCRCLLRLVALQAAWTTDCSAWPLGVVTAFTATSSSHCGAAEAICAPSGPSLVAVHRALQALCSQTDSDPGCVARSPRWIKHAACARCLPLFKLLRSTALNGAWADRARLTRFRARTMASNHAVFRCAGLKQTACSCRVTGARWRRKLQRGCVLWAAPSGSGPRRSGRWGLTSGMPCRLSHSEAWS